MTSRAAFLLAAGLLLAGPAPARSQAAERPPNIVIVFADDLGYGDLGCYGAGANVTPNLDRMAREGIRFTDFYAAQAVCSASRTALLTGCYPNRVGILGALGPDAKIGISDKETILAQVLKGRGYATAIYGKWHLGHRAPFLPTRHGFDEYFGLPYSNDMWPRHPTSPVYPDLPLFEGETTVALNPDQRMLTTWYTEHAVRFIDQNHERPFFLYVPHSMTHVPLHVSPRFAGKTGRGLFGDVMAEVDWSVGEILAAIDRHKLERRTLVIFTSDNGPWLSYGDNAGSAGSLREGKATTFEGGQREPFVARWVGTIPAGAECRQPAMTIDLLPTIANFAGATLASDRVIDGRDIGPLLIGQTGASSPHEALYFYWNRELQAIRSGRWKLHFPHEYRSLRGRPGHGGLPGPYVVKKIGLSLFDLDADPGETTDVASAHPEVVKRLESLADAARADLGDSATGKKGAGVRPPGKL